jgi:hypothetical protein
MNPHRAQTFIRSTNKSSEPQSTDNTVIANTLATSFGGDIS